MNKGLLPFSFLFFFQLGYSCRAQPPRLAVGGAFGPNFSRLNSSALLDEGRRSEKWIAAGLQVETALDKVISLQTGLQYERKGISGFTTLRSRPVHMMLDYVAVPLFIKATLGRHTHFFALGGAYYGLPVRQRTSYAGSSPDALNEYNRYSSYDLGLAAGLGVSIPVSPQWRLCLEGRYQSGLRNVDRLGPVYHTSLVTSSASLLAGASYTIKSGR